MSTADDEFDEDFSLYKNRHSDTKKKSFNINLDKDNGVGNNKTKDDPIHKKPLMKSGIALIVVAIICLSIINFVPWLYVKYDSELSEAGHVEGFYYKDFETPEDAFFQDEVYNFFQSRNMSVYTGVNIDDFSEIPDFLTLCFYSFLILGIIYSLFAVYYKFKNFDFELSVIIQAVFAGSIIIISALVIFASLKFLGAHLLYNYNFELISNNLLNAVFIFPSPVIIIFTSAGIMKVAFSFLKINIREISKKINSDTSDKTMFTYMGGRRS